MNKHPPSDCNDFLARQLRDLPYFRALLRSVETAFYQNLDFPAPLLDLGCGDGHFASVTFDRPVEVGLDPWHAPIHEARRRGAYRWLVEADGGHIPFPDGYFASAFSNSVLEHIPQVEQVLQETARVLKPGAPFVFCVPNQRFNASLSVAVFLDRVRLKSLATWYRAFFTRISRHRHLDGPEVWQARLQRAGFVLERWWDYFSPRALAVLEWGHYAGLPSLLARKLFGRWILVPARWNLALTERLVRPYATPTTCADGVYTFYLARRGHGRYPPDR
jgi:SAM-dependent methyltransferase